MIITWLNVRTMTFPVRALIAVTVASVVALSGCQADDSPSSGASITVSASFYPLQYVAEAVAGDRGDVTTLTAPGVEPHDLELSPAAVRDLAKADVVLAIAGFQPAIDEAIDSTGVHAVDAGTVVPFEAAERHSEEGDDDHEHADYDPHFWLDPALLADFAVAVGAEFATLDPDNAATYTTNADQLAAALRELDQQFVDGLASCERTDIIVTHEAFGYLAHAYGLHQEGLAGLDPDAEPSPARLLEIKDVIESSGATTVFTEALVSPKVAEALAADAGVVTMVLDPVESVAEGDDYIGAMTRNLENLRGALNCA